MRIPIRIVAIAALAHLPACNVGHWHLEQDLPCRGGVVQTQVDISSPYATTYWAVVRDLIFPIEWVQVLVVGGRKLFGAVDHWRYNKRLGSWFQAFLPFASHMPIAGRPTFPVLLHQASVHYADVKRLGAVQRVEFEDDLMAGRATEQEVRGVLEHVRFVCDLRAIEMKFVPASPSLPAVNK